MVSTNRNGSGGFTSESLQGLNAPNNPSTDFVQYGYTKFLELKYDKPVYVSSLLIGENRGM